MSRRHQIALGIGPVDFRITSDWRQPIAALDALYAPYPPADPASIATATVRLEAARPWRRWLRPSIHIRGDYTIPDALPLPLAQGLLAAEMGMNLQVALGWQRHLLLHASSVERDGRAIIMVGESGSGKSTLAALLGEEEWRLMGDEFAFIDLADGREWPFPRPVSLKNDAVAALTRHLPASRFGPPIAGTPKGLIRHLVPRADAIRRMHEPAVPALLLFPRFGAPSGLHPIAPSEAFIRLTDSSTNYVALGQHGFDTLDRLVRTIPAVSIGYASGEEGVAAVRALWEGIGA